MSNRYAVVGLAHPRSAWFREVARWSSTGSLPVELDVCLSGEEARVRLRADRATSVLLVDGAHPAADRDLFVAAHQAGAVVMVVDDGRGRPWEDLGVDQVLPALFERHQLAHALTERAPSVSEVVGAPLATPAPVPEGGLGTLIVVTGAGGSGTSTTARALAQGLGPTAGAVLLADLALHADQAMAHDVGDVVPGLQELVEACRTGEPGAEAVASLTFGAPHLPYRLLLGLRRHRDWTLLRGPSTAAALTAVRRAHDLVVADVDPDVEGEAETGSPDIADRNLLARSCAPLASLVLITARPDTQGLHRLHHHVSAAVAAGTEHRRILPVLVGAPRRPSARARLTATIAALAPPGATGTILPPLLVGWRGDVERAVRDGRTLPRALAATCAGAVTVALQRVPPVTLTTEAPEAVAAGSLGSWRSPADLDRSPP